MEDNANGIASFEDAKKAASLALLAMKLAAIPKMIDMVDDAGSKTGVEFQESLTREIESQAIPKRCQIPPEKSASAKIDFLSLQVGGHFDINSLSMQPLQATLPMHGTFALNLAACYNGCHACIARTVIFNPTSVTKIAYTVASRVHAQICSHIKAGVVMSDLYNMARRMVGEASPDLLPCLAKSLGFGLGAEMKIEGMEISAACDVEVKPGMSICVATTFGGTDWIVRIADTALVPLNTEGVLEIPTKGCSSSPQELMFEIEEESGAEESTQPKASGGTTTAPASSVGVKSEVSVVTNAAMSSSMPPPMKEKVKDEEEKLVPTAKAKAKGKSKAKATPKEKPSASPQLPIVVDGKADVKAKAAGKARSKAKASTEKATAQPAKDSQSRKRPRPEAPIRRERETRQRSKAAKEEMSEMSALEIANKERQKQKAQEILERFGASTVQENVEEDDVKLVEYKAYKSHSSVPDAPKVRVHLDVNAEALLLPIGGMLWPLHVRMIRNMSRQQDGPIQKLRINLFTPGLGKPLEAFPVPVINQAYVKELSFQSDRGDHLDAIISGFKDLRKQLKDREAGKGQEGVAKDVVLRFLPSYPCIRDVNMRPTLGTGRRSQGNLQAHANGFRFSYGKGHENVDIPYSNIAHAIFQPCENALIVLFHLHLKEPMLVGNKKTTDIQFFTETGNMTEDLSMRRAGDAHDPDEVLEEQREQEMVQRLNKLFLDFSRKVEEIWKKESCPLKLDMPFVPMKFQGVPQKAHVELFPTTGALVSLREWPPFVIDMHQVDIVCFERYLATLREFDIVFVMKDFSKMPVRITTIPQDRTNVIKRWLSDLKITWYASSFNLQWQKVMKEINTNLAAFAQDGGWETWLSSGRDDDQADSGEQDEGSEYNSEDANNDGGGSSEESIEDADDTDADESDTSAATSEDDEGEEWEELERQALLHDRRKAAQEAQKTREFRNAPAAKRRR